MENCFGKLFASPMFGVSKKLIQEIEKDVSSLGSLAVQGSFIVGLAFLNPAPAFKLAMGIVAVTAIGVAVKILWKTKRPDHETIAQSEAGQPIADRIDASSFPSIHSARVSVMAILLSDIGNAGFDAFLWFVAIAVMISRVALQKHRVVDCIAGAILGITVGLIL